MPVRLTAVPSSGGIIAALALVLFSFAPPVSAQAVDWDPRAAEVTREELTELLERLEVARTATGYSQRLREQAREEAEYIRARLVEGDFQVGDRIVLEIPTEPELSDTLVVTSGRVVTVPQVGAISLDGVLRSELQGHLETELGRYLRNPVIRATALIRLGIMGAVGSQGFYTVPATLLLEDAIMHAGGPAERADLDGLTIERGDREIWSGEQLQSALIEGRTLDQMNLRAGDRIVVPQRTAGFFEGGVVRTLLITIPPLIYAILQFTR